MVEIPLVQHLYYNVSIVTNNVSAAVSLTKSKLALLDYKIHGRIYFDLVHMQPQVFGVNFEKRNVILLHLA
jgi:hypothetical protein